MKKLVILGGSGIGMIAASIAVNLNEYEIIGFLNDVIPVGTDIGRYKKYKVVGRTEDIDKFLKNGCYFFIAYVGLRDEKSTFSKIESLSIPPDRFATLIHPSAIVPKGFVEIGNGCLLAPLCQLSPDVTLEDNVILLANSFVGHDSTLKKFAHVATNGVVGANVVIGNAVHVGSNATIRERVNVGNFSLIGSGAVLLTDTPENCVYVGNPARLLIQR